jgi:hypothetical protein
MTTASATADMTRSPETTTVSVPAVTGSGGSLLPVDRMVPGANLAAYVQAVSAIPVLSVERERELAERLAYENDVQAARELVMSHLRFVVHIARSYSGYGLAEADLIQEGNVGLMKAVKRFDPSQGRASRVLRGALDQGGNPRVHPAQLAYRQGRHDQGAAQAVLQPAQRQEKPGLADGRRGAGRGRGPRRRRAGGTAHGRPPGEPRRRL